ncbi:unnamed protein product [Hermetia illucens]|uniref:PABS domain-containing protein n=1 Tax=Hermetia illucens TaxID=343691 RepID=A0A7R8V3E6_HERIL|nr:spermidine synthase-like [Hermetia illucens]CAD7091933.1 unnamed protein product [Hermetia illucens]
MDTIEKGWFSEIHEDLLPGQAFSMRVKKVLHEEKSRYQDIQIVETTDYGRALILDGIIQCTLRDEFSYQEMISFLPLCAHPNPEKVLIVGGGDGGVAREAVKHPAVKEVHQVEIDDRVVELSKKYLPEMACGFDHPKLHLTIGDGFEYMKNHKNEFDVIITDSSDPIGPAVALFEESYYGLLKTALRPGGIVCSQGNNYWCGLDYCKSLLENCKKHFPTAAYAFTTIPSYPCGSIGFAIGCLDPERKLDEPLHVFTKAEVDKLNLRYYTSETHRASFVLPRFVEKALYES